MTPQNVSAIHTAVVHCSANIVGQNVTMGQIDITHKARGFSMFGYHRFIDIFGGRHQGRPFARRGAHVAGNNWGTVGVCIAGGLNEDGDPEEGAFLDIEMEALHADLWYLKRSLPGLKRILGHRDYSPDLNGDGIITPNEWIKACPCMNIKQILSDFGLAQFALPASVDVKDIP